MRKLTLITVSLFMVVGLLVTTGSSLAKSSKTPIEFYEVDCLVDLGDQRQSGKDGKMLHTRGQVGLSTVYAATFPHAEIGVNTIVSNSDINTETGEGQAFGTYSGFFSALGGGFDGTWTGTISGFLTSDFQFHGRAVGKGTGELAGQRQKLSLRSVAPDEVPLAILLALPCDIEEIVGVFFDTGFILNPHGD